MNLNTIYEAPTDTEIRAGGSTSTPPESASIKPLGPNEVSSLTRQIRIALHSAMNINGDTYGGCWWSNAEQPYATVLTSPVTFRGGQTLSTLLEESQKAAFISTLKSSGYNEVVLFAEGPNCIKVYTRLKARDRWMETRIIGLSAPVSNLACSYYGFGGRGKILGDLAEGFGMYIPDTGNIHMKLIMDGVEIGDINVVNDVYAFEELIGCGYYNRISYNQGNFEVWTRCMIGSELFNLSCAKLDSSFNSTVENPSPWLAALQQQIKTGTQQSIRERIPATLTAAQKGIIQKKLSSMGLATTMEQIIEKYSHEKLLNERLTETRTAYDVEATVFEALVEKAKKQWGQAFGRMVLSSNPVTLASKLGVRTEG